MLRGHPLARTWPSGLHRQYSQLIAPAEQRLAGVQNSSTRTTLERSEAHLGVSCIALRAHCSSRAEASGCAELFGTDHFQDEVRCNLPPLHDAPNHGSSSIEDVA